MCKVRWQFWDAPYISSRLKVCLSDISRISLSVRNRTLPSMDLFYALKPSSREITMGRETRGMPQWIAISTYVPKMQMQIGVRNPIHISLSLSLSLSQAKITRYEVHVGTRRVICNSIFPSREESLCRDLVAARSKAYPSSRRFTRGQILSSDR